MTQLKFGRSVEHDPRSWAYRLDDAVAQVTVTSVEWARHAPVYDQGSLGSCVGYAVQSLCGATPNWEPLSNGTKGILKYSGTGVKLYGEATQLDAIPGEYPPADTGSSGLGGAKAALKRGYIKGYTHAFSFDVMLKALMTGPLMVGTNFYDSMLTPTLAGTVSITPNARVLGGHEYLVYGYDSPTHEILCQNSWGTDWGREGRFSMSTQTMRRLLSERGDATQFVPLHKPAPAPLPVIAPEDLQLWTAVQAWGQQKGIS